VTARQLVQMAARGAEDGHDTSWHASMSSSDRIQKMMREAHDNALAQLKNDEAALVMEQPFEL